MIIYANVYGGQLTVDLTGTGAPAGIVSLTPATVPLRPGSGRHHVAFASGHGHQQRARPQFPSAASPSPRRSLSSSNSCGTTSLAREVQLPGESGNSRPRRPGAASGLLTFTDAAGTQTVTLTGTGGAAANRHPRRHRAELPVDARQPTLRQRSPSPSPTSGDLPLTGIVHHSERTVSGNRATVDRKLPRIRSAPSACSSPPFKSATVQGTLTIVDALRTQTVALSGTGLAAPAISAEPRRA